MVNLSLSAWSNLGISLVIEVIFAILIFIALINKAKREKNYQLLHMIKTLPWITIGIAVGVAAFFFFFSDRIIFLKENMFILMTTSLIVIIIPLALYYRYKIKHSKK